MCLLIVIMKLVSKNLSIERLERAWNELIIENDALRLVFSKDGKRQKVLESVPYYNLKVYNTDLDGKETVESIRDDMSQQIMEHLNGLYLIYVFLYARIRT